MEAITKLTLNNLTAEVKVGATIDIEGRQWSEELVACEVPEFAPYRFPSQTLRNVTGCVGLACRVEITGRTFQFRAGKVLWVRCKVVFVGDGEPDTEVAGWLKV